MTQVSVYVSGTYQLCYLAMAISFLSEGSSLPCLNHACYVVNQICATSGKMKLSEVTVVIAIEK